MLYRPANRMVCDFVVIEILECKLCAECSRLHSWRCLILGSLHIGTDLPKPHRFFRPLSEHHFSTKHSYIFSNFDISAYHCQWHRQFISNEPTVTITQFRAKIYILARPILHTSFWVCKFELAAASLHRCSITWHIFARLASLLKFW